MFDAYLKIDEVPGDSTSQGFEDHFEVLSFSHEITQELGVSRSMAGAGATGRAEHGSMTINKRIDKASPWLMEMCSSGAKRNEAILKLVRATGTEIASEATEKVVYMSYHMRGVDIQMIKHYSADDTALVYEEFGIQYDSIVWTWTSDAGQNVGSWNRVTNEATVEG
ncbi:MAG: type VI secretion system tube protein Hcp [Gemmatimonadales bacterium]|nr:MAG: type VI secretion system tube protein Hcp [Gemmatimonadales bacterium]